MHHLITITLPIRDNDGSSLSHHHDNLQASLLDIAGGYSSQAISGAWKSEDGRVYRDESIRYETLVSVEDSESAYWEIAKVVERIAKDSLQECILVTISEGHIVRYVEG